MNDAEYLFRQTEIERKRIGRGDYNKKRGGGRYVRLPSDNLSRKEKRLMNGQVASINMTLPTKWETFRNLSTDLQRDYVLLLEKTYGATSPMIAKMLGISHEYFRDHRGKNGYPAKRGGFRNPDMTAWNAFLARTPSEPSEDAPVETAPAPATVDTPENEKPAETVRIDADEKLDNLALLITALRGTGAKLTIEVTL